LADAEALLKDNPKDQNAHFLKIGILVEAGRLDQALAEADAVIAADPKASNPHISKAAILERAHRQADAEAEYDAALARNRTAQGYLSRASVRPAQDYVAQLKDLDEALKLDPGNERVLSTRSAIEARRGDAD